MSPNPNSTVDPETTSAEAHPERFDAGEHGGGKLMEAEHRGRYWWAAQIATGMDILDAACGTGYGMAILAGAGAAGVTGIDLDRDAVEAARRTCGSAGEVVEGDVRELPFDDDRFDLVVCWETIEHVADGARVVAEFRRVLRPDGILLISSPNPDVYPAGNEHHVHEYRPQELTALVREHFGQTARYAQSPRLASAIEPAPGTAPHSNGAVQVNGGGNGTGAGEHPAPQVRSTIATEPGAETYGIVAASEVPLPQLDPMVALGGDFEVRWWSEQVESITAEAQAAVKRVELETQRHLAAVAERETELRQRLQETAAALYTANQELAQLPILDHRVSQAQAETAVLRATYESSRSWRMTAPFRRLVRRWDPRA
jgi:SAM-dependent methyltransferase